MEEIDIPKAVAIYRDLLVSSIIPPKEFSDNNHPFVRKDALAHCHFLLPYIEIALAEGELEKAKQILDRVQTILWAKNIYTWTELKSHIEPLKTKISEEV